MSRLIDAEEVHNLIRKAKKYTWTSPTSTETKVTVSTDEIQFGIDKIPTVDAVPVVRCGECTHRRQPDGFCPVVGGFCGNENWFCACGIKEER